MCRIEHYRSAGRAVPEIARKPRQLFVAERAHAPGFQIGDIYETDEMNSFVIEAGPSRAPGTFAIALQKLLAVVLQHVVRAGKIA
jgi:hypothetical protein